MQFDKCHVFDVVQGRLQQVDGIYLDDRDHKQENEFAQLRVLTQATVSKDLSGRCLDAFPLLYAGSGLTCMTDDGALKPYLTWVSLATAGDQWYEEARSWLAEGRRRDIVWFTSAKPFALGTSGGSSLSCSRTWFWGLCSRRMANCSVSANTMDETRDGSYSGTSGPG
jgi:hypothetical protein